MEFWSWMMITQRIDVDRIETVCFAIIIEGLLARVIHQHSSVETKENGCYLDR